MGYYARLKHGSKEIDLTAAPYCLDPSFVPPATNPATVMSSGLMSNRNAGGQRIDRKFLDRVLNVPVQCQGSSSEETGGAARRLTTFLDGALNDKSEKTYFVFGHSDSVTYEPKWGQLFLYYEIKDAPVGDLWRNYLRADVRSVVLVVNLALTIAPLATGLRQRVGTAQGGIYEHTYATPDGISRGLMIMPAATNEVANPIFGNTTWNQGWSEGADLLEGFTITEEYYLFGDRAAKLTGIGAANNYYRTSVTCAASTTYFSCYAKMADGSEIDNTILNFEYNGVAKAETFVPVGDGWYWVYTSAIGTGGAANFDIYITDQYTVFIDGVMVAVNDNPLFIAHGDMMDVAFAGASHNSDSTRTAAGYYIDSALDVRASTVEVVWMPHFSSTTYTAGTYRLCYDDTSNWRISYVRNDNEWRLYDGTTTITASSETFSAGEVLVFHGVHGPNGLVLYKNGSSVASSGTYTPTTNGDLYIGSTDTPNQHIGGTFLGVTIWNQELTATEISDRYDDIQQWVEGGDGYGQSLSPIPWIWSDDGDNVIDSYYDSTHENFCIAGGVPGNISAETIFYMYNSALARAIAISNFKNSFYIDMSQLFNDNSGHVDINAVGGEVEQITVDTTADAPTTDIEITDDLTTTSLMGKPFRIWASFSDADSGLSFRPSFIYGSQTLYGEWRSVGADATLRVFVTYEMTTPPDPHATFNWMIPSDIEYTVNFIRSSGSDTVELDYMSAMIGDWCYMEPLVGDTRSIILQDKKAYGYMAGPEFTENIAVDGDYLDLYPNGLNHLVILSGDLESATDIDATVSIYRLYVTPRWSIL